MPIKLPADLPAYDILTREGVSVLDETVAARQDIRPQFHYSTTTSVLTELAMKQALCDL